MVCDLDEENVISDAPLPLGMVKEEGEFVRKSRKCIAWHAAASHRWTRLKKTKLHAMLPFYHMVGSSDLYTSTF